MTDEAKQVDILERMRQRANEVMGPFAGDATLMKEAAVEISELRCALIDLLDEVTQAGFRSASDYKWKQRIAAADAALSAYIYGGADR